MRIALCVVLMLNLVGLEVAGAEKIPVLFDTDIGTDIDDAFALALILSSPELELKGVTTVSGDAGGRAMICCRFLNLAGRKDVPVAAGKSSHTNSAIEGQYQYGRRPNWGKGPVKESAVDFLYGRLKADPGKLTLLSVGDLTNVGQLITEHPDCKPWIKRIVMMGGAVRVGYNAKPPAEAEWNIKSDIKNAQVVFASGVPLTVAPLDSTTMLQMDETMRQKIFGAATPVTNQVWQLYQLWDKPTPTLFDPVAVMLCFDQSLCTMEDLCLEVDDAGLTKEVKGGKPNAQVATSIQRDEFLKWYVNRLTAASGKPLAKERLRNVSKPVARGGLPNRVHAFEDFETDIERRWWLVGKLETKNVPPGSSRACRGVLSVDFDDQQGSANRLYTAVIFNPVPGPPMGKNPRISFRYWLKGAADLRVQLYSLSNGYHRQLTLTGLPQEKWESATVDMTAARRPDGSGGPLSEDERIDDIQFYTDPSAELIIDDIVLYDAAQETEKRPFPERVHYTGWFDTGAQGREWPGDFAIVPKEKPLTWKAAKSVDNVAIGAPWIRLHLRGERIMGETTQATFRYKLSGADAFKVVLVNRTQKRENAVQLKGLKQDEWAEASVEFKEGDAPKKGDKVDEILFLLPKGAELIVDDVLLFAPGPHD